MKLISAALLLLCAVSNALGWNGAGHKAIAYIAYQNLTPAQRRHVVQILRTHPDFARWTHDVPANRPELLGLVAFMRAAAWPDEIRGDSRFSDAPPSQGTPLQPAAPGFPDALVHAPWHFINQPFEGEDLAHLTIRPGTQFREGETILERIPALQKLIASTNSAEQRFMGYRLSWLMHLIGDIHQPLHVVTRFSAANPQGDRGGNSFKTEKFVNGVIERGADNLHTFWDHSVGENENIHSVASLGDVIMKLHPKPAGLSQDPERWFEESSAASLHVVYAGMAMARIAQSGLPIVPFEYFDAANLVSGERIALAGYRLAAALASF